MFGDMEVADTDFGYHTIPDNDDREGSNDESVSANKYTLTETNTEFIAERTESYVVDADGPDGQGDGIIAFNEQEDEIKGKTGPVLEQEHWNNNLEDYINEDDLPSLECPGETIRCLVSIDITTKPDNWGANPQNSFKIEITE